MILDDYMPTSVNLDSTTTLFVTILSSLELEKGGNGISNEETFFQNGAEEVGI